MNLPFSNLKFSFRVSHRNKTPDRKRRTRNAFTIIEIALCLGIIGFALVAILGVLPMGLSVQKENRQETIINQDAAVWMEAIRGGSRGYDELTNYVLAITNIVYYYTSWTNLDDPPEVHIFTHDAWTIDGTPQPQPLLLTNGYHIIGLLSRPTVWPPNQPDYQSNYIMAAVRAISGAAVEKNPQTHPEILQDAFSYRLIVENFPYLPHDPRSTNFSQSGLSDSEIASRSNYWRNVKALQTNSHNLRLSFRWPFLPNGELGLGRQTFRMLSGGQIVETRSPAPATPDLPLYFIQPSVYTNSMR